MTKTLSITFNVFLSDDFEQKVAQYYNESIVDITEEDIREFLENNIIPARSDNVAIEVEGGDTDGWFIQNYKE